MIPQGATVLEPVGTAPGLVVTPRHGTTPTIVVLPGPPRELQTMWEMATATDAFRAATAGATTYRRGIARLFGMPESEIANTLRAAEEAGLPLEPLEITTCLRRGEIEVTTLYEPPAQPAYDALIEFIQDRHAGTLFSTDGSTIDEQVAALLADHTIAVAESCSGGLLAARLTDLAGASAYFAGGVVAYSNEAKSALVGVDPGLLQRVGAVSAEVADALADGAAARFGADVGVGITGVAGPGGGTDEKPVGLVFISVCRPGGRRLTRSMRLPGGRADVRERSVTVSMHLIRELLRGGGVGQTAVGEAGAIAIGEAGQTDTREAGQTDLGRGGRDRTALVSTERARLFVGLDLPDIARSALVQWRADHLSDVAGVRWRLIEPEAFHVTLCFLGGRAVADIDPIAAACQVAASRPAVELSLGAPVWLPARRPRAIAVKLVDARQPAVRPARRDLTRAAGRGLVRS